MKKEIEKLQAELDALKAKFENTTKFEKGWYHCQGNRKLFCESEDSGTVNAYGIGPYGNWYNSTTLHVKTISKMTDLEIQEMLTNECAKRGIVEGVTVERPSDWNILMDCIVKLESNAVDYKDNTLWIDNLIVYQNGVFAKVVKPKEGPIMIGGKYEVVFRENHTTIEGNIYTREFWQAALIVSKTNKAGAYVGCDAANGGANMWPVKTETINQILAKI